MQSSQKSANYDKQYTNAFGDPESEEGLYKKDSKLAKAYEVALDIRKFEIELYWKRSGSFWLLVGGIAAALGFLLSGKIDSNSNAVLSRRAIEIACCCLSMAGATISYAWSLVNAGSKFWQRNWEYQVDILEQRILGPLYKTVFSKKDERMMYSVSEINIWISRYVCLIFSLATIVFVIGQDGLTRVLDGISHLPFCIPGASNEFLGYTLKILMVAVNFAVIIYIRNNKVRTDNNKESHDFDVSTEVSVRQVFVEEPLGTPDALSNWKPPQSRPTRSDVPTANFSVRRLVNFVKGFFR